MSIWPTGNMSCSGLRDLGTGPDAKTPLGGSSLLVNLMQSMSEATKRSSPTASPSEWLHPHVAEFQGILEAPLSPVSPPVARNSV